VNRKCNEHSHTHTICTYYEITEVRIDRLFMHPMMSTCTFKLCLQKTLAFPNIYTYTNRGAYIRLGDLYRTTGLQTRQASYAVNVSDSQPLFRTAVWC
jgi:hypothetical protein